MGSTGFWGYYSIKLFLPDYFPGCEGVIWHYPVWMTWRSQMFIYLCLNNTYRSEYNSFYSLLEKATSPDSRETEVSFLLFPFCCLSFFLNCKCAKKSLKFWKFFFLLKFLLIRGCEFTLIWAIDFPSFSTCLSYQSLPSCHGPTSKKFQEFSGVLVNSVN